MEPIKGFPVPYGGACTEPDSRLWIWMSPVRIRSLAPIFQSFRTASESRRPARRWSIFRCVASLTMSGQHRRARLAAGPAIGLEERSLGLRRNTVFRDTARLTRPRLTDSRTASILAAFRLFAMGCTPNVARGASVPGAITLAQVSPADFDVTVVGELAPAELAFGSALEASAL